MPHLETYQPGSTIPFWFNTQTQDGFPDTLLSGAVRVYKQASDTQDDSGITLTADYDSVIGLNAVVIDTSADTTFYSAASEFSVVLTAGTAGGVSVTGTVLANFRLGGAPAAVATSLLLLHVPARQSTFTCSRGF